jgi:hypothetical protein
MSDTPETDATANPLWGDAQELCLLRELARKLERERDEARKKAKNQDERIRFLEWATNHPYGTTLTQALRERDEALSVIRAIAHWQSDGRLNLPQDIARDYLVLIKAKISTKNPET